MAVMITVTAIEAKATDLNIFFGKLRNWLISVFLLSNLYAVQSDCQSRKGGIEVSTGKNKSSAIKDKVLSRR